MRQIPAPCWLSRDPRHFDGIAREAQIPRSWLYNQPDLRAEIGRLRSKQPPTAHRSIPDRQRAIDESLQQRLQVGSQRIRQLETDTNDYATHSQFDVTGAHSGQRGNE